MGTAAGLRVSIHCERRDIRREEEREETILSGAGAALAAKVATGFAAVVLATTAAAAATEATVTGSLNPADWGQQVKMQVDTCKDNLKTGQHGIGACVSAFAKQHGALVSGQHPANGTPANGNKGKHLGNGAGQGKGKPADAPEPADTAGD
jgi:hypothetical protein